MEKRVTYDNATLPVVNVSRKKGSLQGQRTLCGRLGQALKSDAYAGFREGQLTLVNYSRS